MTPADLLRQARALIEKPEHWTQKAYGRTKLGRRLTTAELSEAVSFCGYGALRAVCNKSSFATPRGDGWEASLYLDEAAGGNWIEWQDAPGRKHSTMLRRFDRAIALADSAGATET